MKGCVLLAMSVWIQGTEVELLERHNTVGKRNTEVRFPLYLLIIWNLSAPSLYALFDMGEQPSIQPKDTEKDMHVSYHFPWLKWVLSLHRLDTVEDELYHMC